MQRNRRRW